MMWMIMTIPMILRMTPGVMNSMIGMTHTSIGRIIIKRIIIARIIIKGIIIEN